MALGLVAVGFGPQVLAQEAYIAAPESFSISESLYGFVALVYAVCSPRLASAVPTMYRLLGQNLPTRPLEQISG